MLDIEDEETLVVLGLALETNTLTTNISTSSARQFGLVIHAEDSVAIVIADVALRLGPGAVNISVEVSKRSMNRINGHTGQSR